MKCEICHMATIEYTVHKGQILCPDCAFMEKLGTDDEE